MKKNMLFLMLVICQTTISSFAMDTEALSPAIFDYELFKTVQKIRDITDELAEKFKPSGLEIKSGRKGWPDANQYWNRTQNGLLVVYGNGTYPSRLYTPWGEVVLTGGSGSCDDLVKLAFGQAFLKRIETRFHSISHPGDPSDKVINYEILTEGKKREISAEELEEKKGQSCFILSSYCKTCYSICKVDDHELPSPLPVARYDRDFEEMSIKPEWLKHKERYELETKE